MIRAEWILKPLAKTAYHLAQKWINPSMKDFLYAPQLKMNALETNINSNSKPLTSGDPISNARKPRTKAQALGQVFTNAKLAQRMVHGLGIVENGVRKRLLDPCVGPATFPQAIASSLSARCKVDVDTIDIDADMVNFTAEWSATSEISLTINHCDYLEVKFSEKYDFAILNPPYVRQEWISHKHHYRTLFKKHYGINVPGTANLYIYFIIKVIADLKAGGKMACIVYDSWQSTRFGQWLMDYLSKNCSWVKVEAVTSLPFDGKLIDATIIYAEKGKSVGNLFGSLNQSLLHNLNGLSPLEELFETRRGLRLKQASFFLTELSNAEQEGAQPFVKKVRLIPGFIVPDDHPEAALLVTPNNVNQRTLVTLEHRLTQALASPKENISILTWKEERPETWAEHRATPRAPLIFNYYLRKRPRHIYNPNRIYSDNFFGLIPRTDIPALAWLAAMNSTVTSIGILEQARNQGAGLAKLQLFEYRKALVIDITNWSQKDINKLTLIGQDLIADQEDSKKLISRIDDLVSSVLDDDRLKSSSINEIYAQVEQKARRPKD